MKLLILLLCTTSAHAAFIPMKMNIDPVKGKTATFNNGYEWEYVANINPIVFSQNDRLLITIAFEKNRAIRLTDMGGIHKPDNNGFEQIKVGFSGEGGSNWSVSGSYLLLGGSQEETKFLSSGSTGGGNTFAPMTDWRQTITEDTMDIKGMFLDLSLDEYSSDGTWDKLHVGVFGEKVDVVATVPEPGGLSMAAIGFAFLILLRRLRGEHQGM